MSLDLTDDRSTLVQVITCANVDPDLCCHMASLSHNRLMVPNPEWWLLLNGCTGTKEANLSDSSCLEEKRKIYGPFLLFFTEFAKLVEMLPHRSQWTTQYSLAIPWVLMAWWCKETRHQQPWYWFIYLKSIASSAPKGLKHRNNICSTDCPSINFQLISIEYTNKLCSFFFNTNT